jgi:ferredoxin
VISRRVVLHFPHQLIDQPIIYLLSKEYDLSFNILLARIMPNEEGVMVVELGGEDEKYSEGIKYLQDHGVDVQLLSRDVRRDERRCTQCGACITMCPTGALSIPDRTSMTVTFDIEKCVACSLCVQACPSRAMHIALDGLEELGLEKLT